MMGISTNSHNILKLNALFSPRKYDYYLDNNSRISIHIDDLLHTRTYTSDVFSIILTSCGSFVISYEIMCEEFEEPLEGTYEITVERD